MIPEIRPLLRRALQEDLGRGDLTTQTLVPCSQRGIAQIFAREGGIFSGGPVVRELFRLRDRGLNVRLHVAEAGRLRKGQKVITVKGRIGPILEAERVALNFLGRLSGIATLTRAFVEKIRGTRARIFDTRKTTPLWRVLEKYAVRCGGGENHRFGLWDEVLVKENHWASILGLLRKSGGRYWDEKLLRLKRRRIPVEVEVRDLRELAAILERPVLPDRVLLDNFSVRDLQRAVWFVDGFCELLRKRYRIRRPRPELEASGGIDLSNVRKTALAGVDRISVGRLTHSAPTLDFSLVLSRTEVGAARL
jgi:nicotinate-nucleotide pyrophosphorylase (carboxylating)